MEVTYIYHSSFCVELKDNKIVLIFDYFKGQIPKFPKDTHIYMFASHKHFDHYSKKIFELANEYDNITYVLAKEIKMNTKYMDRWNIPMVARDKIVYVTKNTAYNLPDIGNSEVYVDTIDSTDSGVAYIVNCCGKTIYHSGDLNWWSWPGYTEVEELDMERRFKLEVKKLAQYHIDVAFLPLDPRLEDNFYKGFDWYMRKCDIKIAYPMHLWDRLDTIERLKKMNESEQYRSRIYNYEAVEV